MLSAFVWIVSITMIPVKAIPQKPFQTALHFIELCLTLYIYFGFIKYSILKKQDFFQKLILAALALSVIQSFVATMATLVDKKLFNYNGIPVAIEVILLFYAFKSVQNDRIIHFKKLSRVYLYLSIFCVPVSIALLFGRETLKTMIPHSLIIPFTIFAILSGALIVYAWYLKMRAFKQIATQLY
jgi:hypothetical protein